MSKNDVTGDDLKSKVVNDLYREGFDRIFKKPADLLPPERECCGTFPGTHHRATCNKYCGKFKNETGLEESSPSLLEGEEDVPDTGRTS